MATQSPTNSGVPAAVDHSDVDKVQTRQTHPIPCQKPSNLRLSRQGAKGVKTRQGGPGDESPVPRGLRA